MNSMWVKAALAASVVIPISWIRGDDTKQSDDKKVDKRVEVKVLRLDGKDGDKDVRVLLNDSDDAPAGKQPYLGVAVEAVPPALAAHFPDLGSNGLLVAEVAADSPAAKAGLKEYDVIVTYDDQKLLSGEQLTKLVRADKPGREVVLNVIHAGKSEKMKIAIGEHEVRVAKLQFPGKARVLLDPQGQHKEAIRILKDLHDKGGPGAAGGAHTKSAFSSMRLESLDGDRFKAEIEFKNESGDSLKRSFEGTRDEIRKQIEADKEMPEGIRNQLQHTLEFGKGGGKGALNFSFPKGTFSFDIDSDDFPGFGNFDQIIEQLSNQIEPALREKLKGSLRSLDEQPNKKAVPLDRSL